MIIWGSRTKRQGRGFILRHCMRCRSERVHFVAESTSKFTLYFIPTVTTSRKALLVCTDCEVVTEVDGAQGRECLDAAVSQEAIIRQLEGRDGSPRTTSQDSVRPSGPATPKRPSEPLAVATVAMALAAAAADGSVERGELAATAQAIETIASATRSARVRTVARTVVQDFSDLLAYVVSPLTPAVAVMLAEGGAAARRLDHDDKLRFIGQVAWLCDTIAGSGSGQPDAALEAADAGFEQMGFTAREVAEALAYCEAQGG